jgi:hypothetical protein
VQGGSLWILEDARSEEAFMSLNVAGVILGEVCPWWKIINEFYFTTARDYKSKRLVEQFSSFERL